MHYIKGSIVRLCMYIHNKRFKMYSLDLIQKIQEAYDKTKCYMKVGNFLYLNRTTVRYMVNNDYSRPNKKRGVKRIITDREDRLIKREVKKL